jgi:hypothetical protein
MPSPNRRRRIPSWGRVARRIALAPLLIARLLLLVTAAVFGAVRPQFVRHEDTVCMVEEAERPDE